VEVITQTKLNMLLLDTMTGARIGQNKWRQV